MIYQYKCRKCKHEFERNRPMAECRKRTMCPLCRCKARRNFFGKKLDIVTGHAGRMGTVCTSLPGEPVFVRNKAHFRELCKEKSDKYQTDLYPAGL